MPESLQIIVEEIGKIADLADSDRWKVCEAIASAYAELPAYTRGLTEGLCFRLRRSSDAIYLMRDSWILKERLFRDDSAPALTPSHFSTLFHLQDRYNLSDDEAREWVDLAEKEHWSVRVLSMEIEARCTPDLQKAFLRRAVRLEKLASVAYHDSDYAGLPGPLRQRIRRISALITAWSGALEKWRKEKPPLE